MTNKILFPSLCPIASIQISIPYSLGDMLALDFLTTVEVGDGAGNFKNTTIGTSREGESFHSHAKHFHRGGIRLSILMNHALSHLGIAMDAFEILETDLLNIASTHNALTDIG